MAKVISWLTREGNLGAFQENGRLSITLSASTNKSDFSWKNSTVEISSDDHGFTNGQTAVFTFVGSSTPLSGEYQVNVVNQDVFTLTTVSSTTNIKQGQVYFSTSEIEYKVISGKLPNGVFLEPNGIIVGNPFEISVSTIFNFVVRASTANSSIKDRTFSITIEGADPPTWETPEGALPVGTNNTYFVLDNDRVDFQLEALDSDLVAGEQLRFYIPQNGGELPPGLILSPTGRIYGFTDPIFSIDYSVSSANYDMSLYDLYPYDFGVLPSNGYDSFIYDLFAYGYYDETRIPRRLNRYFQFTVVATDGTFEKRRTFQILVVSEDFLRSDNTIMQAGTGLFRADNTYKRRPIWITESNLGRKRANNYLTLFLDVYDPLSLTGKITYEQSKINPVISASSVLPIRRNTNVIKISESSGIPVVGQMIGQYLPFSLNSIYRITQVSTETLPGTTTVIHTLSVSPPFQENISANSPINIGTESILPPGLVLDTFSGEVLGNLPYQPRLTKSYAFTLNAITVYTNTDTSTNEFTTDLTWTPKTFSLDIVGEVESGIDWISDSDLGSITPNRVSDKYVFAKSKLYGGHVIYELESGTLPTGLTLLSSGEIIGKIQQTKNNGEIFRSSNAISWTATNYNINQSIYSIAFSSSLDLFVMVGEGGTILSSGDTLSWVNNSINKKLVLRSVTFCETNNLFVAVGELGIIFTSGNGSTWIERNSNTTAELFSVTCDNEGNFIAVGQDNILVKSSNGIVWEVSTTAIGDNWLYSIVYAAKPGKFVAVGDLGSVYYSEDGVHWNITNIGQPNELYQICYREFEDSSYTLVAVGYDGTIATSHNIDNWTLRVSPVNEHLYSVATDNIKFMAVGKQGTVLTSLDGTIWTQRNAGVINDFRATVSDGYIFAIAGDTLNTGITRFYEKDLTDFSQNFTVSFDNNFTTFDRVYNFTIRARDAFNFATLSKDFYISINKAEDNLYGNLFVKAFQKQALRDSWYDFITDPNIFNPTKIYRIADTNFGVQSEIKMLVYAGIEAVDAALFVQAISKNHYKKRLKFGNVKKAVAKDPITQETVYEVVYVEIIDDLEKNGKSISSIVELPEISNSPILVNNTFIDVNTDKLNASDKDYQQLYPNSIKNMRKRIKGAGVRDRTYLPLWMRSIQPGQLTETGFVKAVVLCYTVPDQADFIIANIKASQFDFKLMDFEIDRYLIDTINNKVQDKYLAFPQQGVKHNGKQNYLSRY